MAKKKKKIPFDKMISFELNNEQKSERKVKLIMFNGMKQLFSIL